jgi:Lrp/AsnC family transcriptional regulator, leucine-responsive regulatory protein
MLNAIDSNPGLDETDWQLIETLQADARQSYTALGQAVGLSRPAVAERVRRLEDLGVITGYRAVIDPVRVGRSITAFVRLRTSSRSDSCAVSAILTDLPEVLECFRGTGDDCFIIKIAVASIAHLDAVLEQLRDYGSSTTSIILSALVTNRPLGRPSEMCERPIS